MDFGLASGLVDDETNAKVTRNATASDTFLYGSGTKPITAVAVLRLIESGRIRADDLVSPIVDPYLQRWNHTSLNKLFGADIDKATVLDLIHMAAGIRDFEDSYDFDVAVLADGGFLEYPYGAMQFASEIGNQTLYFEPGSGVAYSSTSFLVAGLVLAAVLQPQKPWWEFDLRDAALGDMRTRYPTMSFPPTGSTGTKISESLTVPGTSVSSDWPSTTILQQNAAILGWTCGNMVSSAQDVARIYFDLLHSSGLEDLPRLINDESRSRMLNFKNATHGWNVGKLQYSAGLMQTHYDYSDEPRDLENYNYAFPAWGHGGDTYGFCSQQAYVPKAQVAFSVTSNIDLSTPSNHLACWVMDIVQEVQTGQPGNFNCGYIDFGPSRRRRRRSSTSLTTTAATMIV